MFPLRLPILPGRVRPCCSISPARKSTPSLAPVGFSDANLDGTALQLLTSQPGGIEGLALDLVHSNLYFVNYPQGTIGRTDLDGTGFQLLVSGQSGLEHVALDVAAGKMYWGSNGRIRRANLDGTNIETIVASAPGVDSIRLVLDNVPEPSTLLLAAHPVAIRTYSPSNFQSNKKPSRWLN